MTHEDIERAIVKKAHERLSYGQEVITPKGYRDRKGLDPEQLRRLQNLDTAIRKMGMRNLGDYLTAYSMDVLNVGSGKKLENLSDEAIEDAAAHFWQAVIRGTPLPSFGMPTTERRQPDKKKIAEYETDKELWADEILLPVCRETTRLLVEKLAKSPAMGGKRIGIPGINLCPRDRSPKDPEKVKKIRGYKDYQANCAKTEEDFPDGAAGADGPGNIMHGFCGAQTILTDERGNPVPNPDPAHSDEPLQPWQWHYVEEMFHPWTPERFIKEATEQMMGFTGHTGWSGPDGEAKRMAAARIIVNLRLWPQVLRASMEEGGLSHSMEDEAQKGREAAIPSREADPEAAAVEKERLATTGAMIAGEIDPTIAAIDDPIRLNVMLKQLTKNRQEIGEKEQYMIVSIIRKLNDLGDPAAQAALGMAQSELGAWDHFHNTIPTGLP
jgi:hypothetical protein